jgi:hypothetical protein
MAGNVLVGGLIGVGVDAASGATKELKPNPLAVTLERFAPVSAKVTPDLQTTAAQEAQVLVQ